MTQLSNTVLDQFDYSQNHKREAIPQEATWDLSFLFSSDREWEEAFENLSAQIETADRYAGQLAKSPETLEAALKHHETLFQELLKILLYAHLKNDQDQGDAAYIAMNSKASQLYAELDGKLAFMTPELIAIDQDVIADYLAKTPALEVYRHFFDQLQREKAHILSHAEEKLLAQAGDILGVGGEVFSVFSDADLKFPSVKVDGKDVEITQANYVPLLENPDREIRKEVFHKYFGTYKQFENTLALTLQKQIKQDNFFASVRNYDSARAAALYSNAIPEKVFDQLIDTVSSNLDLLHQYVSLRKEKLNLAELHPYDLYVSLVEDTKFSFTPSEAQQIVMDALKPLGEEYGEGLEKAFSERWIDWFPNQGKRSGAYSTGMSEGKPYILTNWQGTLDSVFTLIHELGHSMHSYFSNKQPFIYREYSIFLAEIASTTNENLLTEYLLKNEFDPKRRQYIINHYLDGFKGTVFRQTQFAKFEHQIHQAEQNGKPLTAEYLNELYGKINKEFYGPDLCQDPEISMEWIRIPHFYYNYYVYQYATGFSAATTFAHRILNEGESAVKQYLNFLKAGSSDYPIQVLQKSGLDMTEARPIEEALQAFERYLGLFREE